MERLDIFRKAIVEVMTEYAQYLEGSNLPDVRYSVVEDKKNDVYQLMAIGWEKSNRVYNIIFHPARTTVGSLGNYCRHVLCSASPTHVTTNT
jgi:XisI protein